MPIWGPHHDDVDLDTFESVDAVHPRALDRRLAFEVMPSAVKKAIAAARSSTTTLTWSNLLIVMSLVSQRPCAQSRPTVSRVGLGYRRKSRGDRAKRNSLLRRAAHLGSEADAAARRLGGRCSPSTTPRPPHPRLRGRRPGRQAAEISSRFSMSASIEAGVVPPAQSCFALRRDWHSIGLDPP